MCRTALVALALIAFSPPAAPTADPPQVPREFRGVWVATVGNIDWPSKPGLPVDRQKVELIALLDRAAELRMNAVIFQVRPMADALYKSDLEPWSGYLTGTPGAAPEPAYDPLALAVKEAHARGLELHAWFNPYRARHPTSRGDLPRDHLVSRRPDLAKPYGQHHWMNPTHPDVQSHSLAVVLDVVRRYDVDGVHIDDYFYPYKETDAAGKVIPFPDDDTWATYVRGGGKLARDDWRRDAVNQFIARMYREVKAAKPWVKVGISPFGIWRPGHPAGISGLDQYSELYADARLWWREGWVDYLSPQLYWPIAQEKQSFTKLLAWWAGENVKGRHLWPGLYTSRAAGLAPGKAWPATEIADQITAARHQSGCGGAVHFSMKAFLRSDTALNDAIRSAYPGVALVPAAAAPAVPLPPPVVVREGGRARVQTPDDVRFVLTCTLAEGKWTPRVVGSAKGHTWVDIPQGTRTIVATVNRAGLLSEYGDLGE